MVIRFPSKLKLSANTRALLALCSDKSLGGRLAVVQFLDAEEDLEWLAKELRPLVDSAARKTLLSATASLLMALLAGGVYIAHMPFWVVLFTCAGASATLLWALRLAAHQQLLETAISVTLPLPPSGPMSRETLEQLLQNVEAPLNFGIRASAKPLRLAHLSLGRALARKYRQERR